MGQHAGLGGDAVALANAVEQVQQRLHRAGIVGGRVDADDGVAVAIGQPVEDAGGDALRVVGRMVRLEPRGHAAGQADGGAEARDDAAFARGRHEVLQAHEFRHRGRHFGREAGRQGREALGGGLIGKQPVAEFADGEVRHRSEGGSVVRIADEARDFVVFVRDERLGQEGLQRDIRQLHLGAHALFGAGGRDARQLVAAPRGRCLRQEVAQVHTGGRSWRWAKAEASSGASTRRPRPHTAK